MDILLGLLTLPLYVLVLWPLVVASRRVLGVRIGTLRALCAAGFGPDVVLPVVHKGLSTDRVLVMSRPAGNP